VIELSHCEPPLSTPSREQLVAWRVFLECAFALIDILDAELRAERGITLRWYDVLVKLEDAEGGLRMTELASRILASKSGLTSVVDRMEEAGLVRRERPPGDRRVVEVFITPQGIEALHAARAVHHRGIREHFVQHLDQRDLAALAHTLEKVRDHVRPLRPGRVSS
jgi:DNA-binding MarR family transcriptional regulator